MCLDILRDAPGAILAAKKQKKIGKTAQVLVEAAIIFAVAAALAVANGGVYNALLYTSAVSVFISIIVAGLLLGLVMHIAASTLGGKGKYFEGLTAVSYMLLPISVGMLVSSILMFLPYTGALQLIVLAVALSLGFATLYRGVKELYSIDMITSLVAVSVSILALIMSMYATVGLTLLTQVASVGMM